MSNDGEKDGEYFDGEKKIYKEAVGGLIFA
jgi:hypothetical protein